MPSSGSRPVAQTALTRRTAIWLGAGGVASTLLARLVPVAAQSPKPLLLAVITLPPMPGKTSWLFYSITIPPDQETLWTATYGACCPGPRIEHVVSGTYRVRAERETQVLRAGGHDDVEAVAAGVEVELLPGDTRIARSEDPFTAAGPEGAPVELLLGAIGPGEPTPLGWSFSATDWEDGLTLPASETKLRLLEVTLAADETYGLPPGVIDQLAVPLENAGTLGLLGDGQMRNLASTSQTVFVLSIEPASLATEAGVATAPP